MVVDVTSENLHEFTLNDIVMPMVGYETRMPENQDLQMIILEIMAKDGITIDHFNKISSVAAASATGGYRRIVSVP